MLVLLVDDEKELVSAIAERLSFRGIEADWLVDGKKAADQVKTKPYDVVVMDMKMPGCSGIRAMKEVLKIRPDMAFVFLTGHGSEEDRKECRESGVEHYMVKPVKIGVLIEKMKLAIECVRNKDNG